MQEVGKKGWAGSPWPMELEVNSEAVAVETVEVVAGGDDSSAAALMGQQLMVTNPPDLIVPSPEVGVSGRVVQVAMVYLCAADISGEPGAGGDGDSAISGGSALHPVRHGDSPGGGPSPSLSECADRHQEDFG